MLKKVKYHLRRAAQKITGLDADNLAIDEMRTRISELETELGNLKNEILFDAKSIQSAIDVFSVPEGFFEPENLIKENNFLINLQAEQNIFASDLRVVEFMCGAGLGALCLKELVGSYLGLDTSETLLKFARKNVRSPGFEFSTIEHAQFGPGSFDVAILSAKQNRWSQISIEPLAALAAKVLAPNGILIIELPYLDSSILEIIKLAEFQSSELVTGKINYIIAKKELCLRYPQQKQSIIKTDIGTTIS